MADEELVINNQGPAGNSSGMGGKGKPVDLDIDGVSGNVKANKNGNNIDVEFNVPVPGGTSASQPGRTTTTSRTSNPQSGRGGTTTNSTEPQGERQQIQDNNEKSPVAQQSPSNQNSANNSGGPAPTPSPSTPTQAPASGSRTPTAEPARSSNPTPTNAQTTPEQKDLAPEKLDSDGQQDAAGDMNADRQRKDLQSNPDNAKANAPDQNKPNPGDAKDPDMEKPEAPKADPALFEDKGLGDLGHGDESTRSAPGKVGEPPELNSPEEKEKAAAQKSSEAQSENKKRQMADLQHQESTLSDSKQKLKGSIANGKLAWAKVVPGLNSLVAKLDQAAKKNVKKFIQILEKIKSLAKAVKSAVAIGEGWSTFAELLGGMCATGVGIIVAIIIAIPGFIVVTIMAVIWPNAASKTARAIDKFIEEINTILKPLKKYYTSTEQRKASLLKVRRLMVATRNSGAEPPPGPS